METQEGQRVIRAGADIETTRANPIAGQDFRNQSERERGHRRHPDPQLPVFAGAQALIEDAGLLKAFSTDDSRAAVANVVPLD